MVKRDDDNDVAAAAAPPPAGSVVGEHPMDVQRFLAKNPMDKRLRDMVAVLFRGRIMGEAAWKTTIAAVIGRRVF